MQDGSDQVFVWHSLFAFGEGIRCPQYEHLIASERMSSEISPRNTSTEPFLTLFSKQYILFLTTATEFCFSVQSAVVLGRIAPPWRAQDSVAVVANQFRRRKGAPQCEYILSGSQ